MKYSAKPIPVDIAYQHVCVSLSSMTTDTLIFFTEQLKKAETATREVKQQILDLRGKNFVVGMEK